MYTKDLQCQHGLLYFADKESAEKESCSELAFVEALQECIGYWLYFLNNGNFTTS